MRSRRLLSLGYQPRHIRLRSDNDRGVVADEGGNPAGHEPGLERWLVCEELTSIFPDGSQAERRQRSAAR